VLLELTKRKTAELQEKPMVMVATKQLESNYKLACQTVHAAQEWVAAVLGYEKKEEPKREQVVEKQIELVTVLKKGVEGVVDIEDVFEN